MTGTKSRIDIFILFAISREPQHGYTLKKLLKPYASNMGVYNALERMQTKGFLKKQNLKQSNYPEKIVYTLTSEGCEEYIRMLRSTTDPEFAVFSGMESAMETVRARIRRGIRKADKGSLEYYEGSARARWLTSQLKKLTE